MIRTLSGLTMLAGAVKLGRFLTPHSDEFEVAGEFVDRLASTGVTDDRRPLLTKDEVNHIRLASRHPKFNPDIAWDIFFEECIESAVDGTDGFPNQAEQDQISEGCSNEWELMIDAFNKSVRALR